MRSGLEGVVEYGYNRWYGGNRRYCNIRSGGCTPPSLTHDGYKLVVKNITPTSTTLKYGSNTYEIGTATNIYVENTGDYSAEIGNATDFALTNTTVSGTIKTVEPGFASRYQGSWHSRTTGNCTRGV